MGVDEEMRHYLSTPVTHSLWQRTRFAPRAVSVGLLLRWEGGARHLFCEVRMAKHRQLEETAEDATHKSGSVQLSGVYVDVEANDAQRGIIFWYRTQATQVVSAHVSRVMEGRTMHPTTPFSTQLVLSLCLCLTTILHCRQNRRLPCTPFKLLAMRARRCAAPSAPRP